jgi:hypothetical protein
MKKQVSNLFLSLGISSAALAQTTITGPSSSQSSYIQPLVPGSTITAIISAGNAVGNYTMSGTPDGLGAFDNGNGSFTLLMNHEFGNTAGIARAHGAVGAFVSKWVINKSNLSVVSGQDLMQNVNLWNGTGYTTYNATNPSTLTAFGRFCSADLPAKTAFYNATTGKGTQERIFMNGEENGTEGRAMAHIVTGTAGGDSYELPYLGKASWENYVASPYQQDKTIVIGMDDATPGQVYVYIGTKQSTGNDITKAGLTGGKLYGVAVLGFLNEGASVPTANTTFNLLDLGTVQNLSGATLNTNSNNVGVTNFLRPEDGAWDPSNPRDFYFNTTNAFSSPSRLWRLRFNDINNPELGGTITAVLNGTEGQKMLDNLGINKYGQAMLQEDVGNNIHNGKIWQYNMSNNSMSLFAQHDTTRFITGGANYLTIDEETSGMIDAQEILGAGMWLFVDQAHYSIPGGVVEGGQLLALYNPSSANANPEVNVQGNVTNVAINSTLTSNTNNTNYGSANLGQNITKSFVIQNSGPGALFVNGITIGGLNAGDFSLLSAPLFPYTVAVNGTLTIYVKFSPGATGLRSGMVTILNNDFDESNYAFAIEGTGVVPEINVNGNSSSIVDSNTALALTNNTDFGSTFLNVPIVKTFEIQNTGTGTLNISGITINGNNSSEFTIVNAMNFPMSLNANSNYTFAIQYLPQTLGTRTAVISVMNDDSDESNYDFLIGAKSLLDVGIANHTASNMRFAVFPNPTKDQATVRISSENAQSAQLTVVDLQGKVVIAGANFDLTVGITEAKLNTSHLAAGEYFVVLNANQTTSTLRLVITH